MNKIEEILDKHLQFSSVRIPGLEKESLKAMKEFGKICFNAGSELAWKSTGDYSGYESYKYKTYEDFLKGIENEEGN